MGLRTPLEQAAHRMLPELLRYSLVATSNEASGCTTMTGTISTARFLAASASRAGGAGGGGSSVVRAGGRALCRRVKGRRRLKVRPAPAHLLRLSPELG